MVLHGDPRVAKPLFGGESVKIPLIFVHMCAESLPERTGVVGSKALAIDDGDEL